MKKLLAMLLVAVMVVPFAIGALSVSAADDVAYTDAVDLMPKSEAEISSSTKAGYSLADGRLTLSRTADSTVAWPSIVYDVNKEVDLSVTPYLHLDFETSGVGDRGANGNIYYKVAGVADASEVAVQLSAIAGNGANDYRDTSDLYLDFAKYLGITEKIIITKIQLSVYGGVGETIYWNHLAFAKEASDPVVYDFLAAMHAIDTADYTLKVNEGGSVSITLKRDANNDPIFIVDKYDCKVDLNKTTYLAVDFTTTGTEADFRIHYTRTGNDASSPADNYFTGAKGNTANVVRSGDTYVVWNVSAYSAGKRLADGHEFLDFAITSGKAGDVITINTYALVNDADAMVVGTPLVEREAEDVVEPDPIVYDFLAAMHAIDTADYTLKVNEGGSVSITLKRDANNDPIFIVDKYDCKVDLNKTTYLAVDFTTTGTEADFRIHYTRTGNDASSPADNYFTGAKGNTANVVRSGDTYVVWNVSAYSAGKRLEDGHEFLDFAITSGKAGDVITINTYALVNDADAMVVGTPLVEREAEEVVAVDPVVYDFLAAMHAIDTDDYTLEVLEGGAISITLKRDATNDPIFIVDKYDCKVDLNKTTYLAVDFTTTGTEADFRIHYTRTGNDASSPADNYFTGAKGNTANVVRSGDTYVVWNVSAYSAGKRLEDGHEFLDFAITSGKAGDVITINTYALVSDADAMVVGTPLVEREAEKVEDDPTDPGEDDTSFTIHFTQEANKSTATGSITLFPAGDEDVYVASEVAGMRWSTALIVNADGTIVSVARQLLSVAQDDKNQFTDHGFTIPAGGFAIVYHAGDNSELHTELQAYTLALCTEVGLAKDGAYTFWNSVVSVESAGWQIAVVTEGGDYGFGYATLYQGEIPGEDDPGEDDPGKDDPKGPTIPVVVEEEIDVDGELNDTGYDVADWVDNGFWQGKEVPEEEISGKYTVRTDAENIYIALEIDGTIAPNTLEAYDPAKFVQNTATNIRVWLKKDVASRTFFDLQYNGSEFTLANWNTNHEAANNVTFVINYEDGKLVAEICVPMADIGVEDSFYLLVSYCENFATGYNAIHFTTAENLNNPAGGANANYWDVENTYSYAYYTVSEIELGEYVKDVLVGDLDIDGEIEADDYAMLKRYVLGTFELTEDQMKLADIDGNGVVDAYDYLLLKRVVLGTYTIGE